MAAQTVVGLGNWSLKVSNILGVLKDQVCSPGGSTIAGVASLEAHAFSRNSHGMQFIKPTNEHKNWVNKRVVLILPLYGV